MTRKAGVGLLLRHEAKHLWQIERDGRVVFAVKYLYYALRYGYQNNLYEIEAWEAEHDQP